MKINIVIGNSDQKWILGRVARELRRRLDWTVNEFGADVDYCIPYLMYDKATAPIRVPLFTHREEVLSGKQRVFDRVSTECGFSVSLSQNTRQKLPWMQAQESKVIHLASDLHKVVRFGVVGKDHASGRKNFHWVKALSTKYSIMYKVLSDNVMEREQFYNYIDYLIVTSSIEGGPVPILDALAMGVPVISGDVGWTWDYPVIRYEKDNFQDLIRVLNQLSTPRTWEDVAQDTKLFFDTIYAK